MDAERFRSASPRAAVPRVCGDLWRQRLSLPEPGAGHGGRFGLRSGIRGLFATGLGNFCHSNHLWLMASLQKEGEKHYQG